MLMVGLYEGHCTLNGACRRSIIANPITLSDKGAILLGETEESSQNKLHDTTNMEKMNMKITTAERNC